MTESAAITQSGASDNSADDFDSPVRTSPVADINALIINLDGFEGPLDVLLELARTQRVDLRKISMLALVDQYLEFVEAAKTRSLELAADYLVMAAWLAYLKSKLLLPAPDDGSAEPTADEMAALLAFQLMRLEAMRKAAQSLLDLPQLGINVFARGMPEGVRVRRKADWQASLYELLQAYTRQRINAVDRTYTIDPPKVYSIEAARARLERILGSIPDWVDLRSLAPSTDVDAPTSSVLASQFNAALEFAKNGRLDIRQLGAFQPIYVRKRGDGASGDRNGGTGNEQS